MGTQTGFTKEEIANSKRIFKSATPKYTADWYVKWVASILVLSAMSVRGIEGMMLWDLTLSLAGLIGWLIVSIMWKDRALIMINGVGLFFIVRNLISLLSS
jgi:fatty-acid desaturase